MKSSGAPRDARPTIWQNWANEGSANSGTWPSTSWQTSGSGVYNGLLPCLIYCVQWNTRKAKPAKKSRDDNKPATGRSVKPVQSVKNRENHVRTLLILLLAITLLHVQRYTIILNKSIHDTWWLWYTNTNTNTNTNMSTSMYTSMNMNSSNNYFIFHVLFVVFSLKMNRCPFDWPWIRNVYEYASFRHFIQYLCTFLLTIY